MTARDFSPIYTQALMLGVGMAGVTVTVARIVSKLASSNFRISSYIYFGFAAVYCLGACLLYNRERQRNPAIKRAIASARDARTSKANVPGQIWRLLSSKRGVLNTSVMLTVVNGQEFMVMPSIAALGHDFLGDGWSITLTVLVRHFPAQFPPF